MSKDGMSKESCYACNTESGCNGYSFLLQASQVFSTRASCHQVLVSFMSSDVPRIQFTKLI